MQNFWYFSQHSAKTRIFLGALCQSSVTRDEVQISSLKISHPRETTMAELDSTVRKLPKDDGPFPYDFLFLLQNFLKTYAFLDALYVPRISFSQDDLFSVSKFFLASKLYDLHVNIQLSIVTNLFQFSRSISNSLTKMSNL